ncbi:hypothetical protein BASA50_010385 [Batrachochytrium salamandrivorans]|uniref:Transmembrane protein n=1 Tax=Batrachochytrium salamandrivorans TaxID=1357716 RepID=A0ABQ8EYS4_9FUNG|nr:hypothetical protein BASA50_010385 [Batrachochytrium salamandrivorans]
MASHVTSEETNLDMDILHGLDSTQIQMLQKRISRLATAIQVHMVSESESSNHENTKNPTETHMDLSSSSAVKAIPEEQAYMHLQDLPTPIQPTPYMPSPTRLVSRRGDPIGSFSRNISKPVAEPPASIYDQLADIEKKLYPTLKRMKQHTRRSSINSIDCIPINPEFNSFQFWAHLQSPLGSLTESTMPDMTEHPELPPVEESIAETMIGMTHSRSLQQRIELLEEIVRKQTMQTHVLSERHSKDSRGLQSDEPLRPVPIIIHQTVDVSNHISITHHHMETSQFSCFEKYDKNRLASQQPHSQIEPFSAVVVNPGPHSKYIQENPDCQIESPVHKARVSQTTKQRETVPDISLNTWSSLQSQQQKLSLSNEMVSNHGITRDNNGVPNQEIPPQDRVQCGSLWVTQNSLHKEVHHHGCSSEPTCSRTSNVDPIVYVLHKEKNAAGGSSNGVDIITVPTIKTPFRPVTHSTLQPNPNPQPWLVQEDRIDNAYLPDIPIKPEQALKSRNLHYSKTTNSNSCVSPKKGEIHIIPQKIASLSISDHDTISKLPELPKNPMHKPDTQIQISQKEVSSLDTSPINRQEALSTTTLNEDSFDAILGRDAMPDIQRPSKILQLSLFASPTVSSATISDREFKNKSPGFRQFLRLFRWFNFLRSVATAIYSVYTAARELQNPYMIQLGASGFWIATIVFVVLDAVVAALRAFPKTLWVFWDVNGWDPLEKSWSPWALIADHDLIIDVFPILANVILKVYGYRLAEIVANPLARDSITQTHYDFSDFSDPHNSSLVLLVLFGFTLFYTIMFHAFRLWRVITFSKKSPVLGMLVILKAVLLLFDVLTNALLLYQVLVFSGLDLLAAERHLQLMLAVVVPSPIVTLTTNTLLNLPLHFMVLRLQLRGRRDTVTGECGENVRVMRVLHTATRRTFHPLIVLVFGSYAAFSTVALFIIMGVMLGFDPIAQVKSGAVPIGVIPTSGFFGWGGGHGGLLSGSNILLGMVWVNLVSNYMVGVLSAFGYWTYALGYGMFMAIFRFYRN